MALSFEESKKLLAASVAPAAMSLSADDGIMTLESADGTGAVAAFSEWTKSDKYELN